MPSSVIRRFNYDPAARVLCVVFVTGRCYQYREVPPPVVDELRNASSKGRCFNVCIRNRYAFRRVSDCPDEPPLNVPAMAFP